MDINQIFTQEWMSKFKVTSYNLEQVRQAANTISALDAESGGIAQRINRNFRPTDFSRLAETSTPSEIINEWPRRAQDNLDKMKIRLVDLAASE